MNLKIRRLVSKNIKHTLHLVTGIVLFAIGITACNEKNELGLEILPGEDLISVDEVVITAGFSAYNFTEEQLISSGGTSLLGSLNDPDFGSTNVNFAAQFRLIQYPAYGINPVVDSVRLYLYYKNVYGDTITPQHFSVYELKSSLSPEIDYKQDIDLKSMSYEEKLGELTYIPKVELDTAGTSIDTAYQAIVIPISNSFGEKLVNMDSTILSNNDSLLQSFKGLFIETQKVTTDVGAILTLETASASRLVVYYNNEGNSTKGPDTTYNFYMITENSARVNQIEHDYTGTAFHAELDQENVQSERLYVQPTGGLKSKIYIDGLESWRDSVNTAINRAEIIFEVDTLATNLENFAPPSQLLFTFIDDEGNEKIPADYYFNPNYYSGYLYPGYEYRFNITQHLQAIIDGDVGNNGFYLSTGRRTQYANRVVLRGTEQSTNIRLVITYSKFLQ